MYYIRETTKPRVVLKLFNIIKFKDDEIILPVCDKDVQAKRAQKLAKKTIKILKQTNSKKVVLSKKIKEQKEYVNLLNSYGISVVEGTWLFKILMKRVLEYVIEKNKWNKEEIKISILVNDVEQYMLKNLKDITKIYKKINVVTNHVEKFKNIEEQLMEESGVVLNVSNNKRKSLISSQIILNVDFPTELINKYNICEEAIIINFRGNVKVKKKRFNGMNINDYEIDFKNSNVKDLYAKKDIYESQIFQNRPIEYVEECLDKDKVQITKLIGCKNFL